MRILQACWQMLIDWKESMWAVLGLSRYVESPTEAMCRNGREVSIEFGAGFQEALAAAAPMIEEAMGAAIESNFSYTYSRIDGSHISTDYVFPYALVETGRYRPSLWTCPYCHSAHPLTAYRCTSCGAPRQKEDR